MKSLRMFLTVTAIIAYIAGSLSATIFTESGVIQDGDYYGDDDPVHVYGDITIIDMTGGEVYHLFSHDRSTINVTGGVVYSAIDSQDESIINVSAGSVAQILCRDNSTANVTGGTFSRFEIGRGTVHMSGGQITGMGIYAPSSGIIHIHGYDFHYEPWPDSTDKMEGTLTGLWQDDTPFSIDFYHEYGRPNSYDQVVLHEIPEPASLLLIAFGVLLLKKGC